MIWRSFLAVLAGIALIVVLSVGTDGLMRAAGVFPPVGQPMGDPYFILATAYRTIYGVAGGYLAAKLAPQRPMAHALFLGFVGLAVSVLGSVSTWTKGPEFGPHWYPLALVATALPSAWAGGKIAGRGH